MGTAPHLGVDASRVIKPDGQVDLSDLIRLQTAGRLRDVQSSSIRDLIRRGRLWSIKIDGTTFVSRTEVLAFKPGRRIQVREMTDEEVLDDVRRVVILLGHWPTTTEHKQHGKINLTVLWRRFGRWKQVRAAAQRQRAI